MKNCYELKALGHLWDVIDTCLIGSTSAVIDSLGDSDKIDILSIEGRDTEEMGVQRCYIYIKYPYRLRG